MPRPITLFENLRAVPYTPFYLAIARGDWVAEGIDVSVKTSPAMSQTAEALLDGRADVSWGGPMRVMMHHDADPKSPLVCFGQVVAGDPFILVGRTRKRRFQFADLIGQRLAVAIEAPTPWLTFQDDVGRAGIDPGSLRRMKDRPMAQNVAAFKRGRLDIIQVFEPYADALVQSGAGHIWHRFATRGDIAYTSFYTTRTFARRNRKTCEALVRGIARAQKALHRETPGEIAKAIGEFFPDIAPDGLARMIKGYRDSGLWARTPALPTEAFTRLKAALVSGNLIHSDPPYERLVDNALSNAAD
jgi:NitT/TauT family transport system substrate-binding protein